MSNCSIWPTDRILSGATTPSQSGPQSNGKEGVLRIPESYSITRASPSNCLVSYAGHPLAERGSDLICRDAVGVFYCPNRLGWGGWVNVYYIKYAYLIKMIYTQQHNFKYFYRILIIIWFRINIFI